MWIGLIILAVLVLFPVLIYNSLVSLRNRARSGWSQIDVQLKRRHNLIPNLIEVCKGYMKYEKEVLENVTRARTEAVSAGGTAEKARAENSLTKTLRSLFAVTENYPGLKANQNMLALQEELTSTENKISFARQHYNDQVMRFNTAIEKFPQNIIAGMFGFKEQEFFEAESPEERGPVQVKF